MLDQLIRYIAPMYNNSLEQPIYNPLHGLYIANARPGENNSTYNPRSRNEEQERDREREATKGRKKLWDKVSKLFPSSPDYENRFR